MKGLDADVLAQAGHLDRALAERLARAAGFRNVVAHAYEGIDMARVHAAATDGPDDLKAFLRIARDIVVPKVGSSGS
ncbi:MAG: HepT-like ribonuclease domain-containing protein [Candidatus Binatia bacterium]